MLRSPVANVTAPQCNDETTCALHKKAAFNHANNDLRALYAREKGRERPDDINDKVFLQRMINRHQILGKQ